MIRLYKKMTDRFKDSSLVHWFHWMTKVPMTKEEKAACQRMMFESQNYFSK